MLRRCGGSPAGPSGGRCRLGAWLSAQSKGARRSRGPQQLGRGGLARSAVSRSLEGPCCAAWHSGGVERGSIRPWCTYSQLRRGNRQAGGWCCPYGRWCHRRRPAAGWESSSGRACVVVVTTAQLVATGCGANKLAAGVLPACCWMVLEGMLAPVAEEASAGNGGGRRRRRPRPLALALASALLGCATNPYQHSGVRRPATVPDREKRRTPRRRSGLRHPPPRPSLPAHARAVEIERRRC